MPDTGGERLQKVLARAGVASRRACEEIIQSGRVTVNGKVVTELGTRVSLGKDRIAVDGKALELEPLVYLLLHKPEGYVTTARDPQNRPTVLDLVKGIGVRVFPVGRLDYDSSGLLFLTNDGELAHRLTHPRFGVEKIYHVKVTGKAGPAEVARLRKGVLLSDGTACPVAVKFLRNDKDGAWMKIVLREGRNRLVRRLCAAVGLEVVKLVRVREAGISLGSLPPGCYRHLSQSEVRQLHSNVKTPR